MLQAAGGRILPVHMEAGQRVSYGPYRAVSRALIKLLNRSGTLRSCSPVVEVGWTRVRLLFSEGSPTHEVQYMCTHTRRFHHRWSNVRIV